VTTWSQSSATKTTARSAAMYSSRAIAFGQYWGRGVSVVGDRNVTITANTCRACRKQPGFWSAQEDGYPPTAHEYRHRQQRIRTSRTRRIRATIVPLRSTPAIDLNTGPGSVMLVSVTGNQIRARITAIPCVRERMSYRRSATLHIDCGGTLSLQSRGCSASQIVCGANTQDGKTWCRRSDAQRGHVLP